MGGIPIPMIKIRACTNIGIGVQTDCWTGLLSAPYTHYTGGYAYARDSIRIAFEDVEDWLVNVDNGRAGCGAAGDCPRTWVSPFFNSGRVRSLKILTDLGSITMGEQKISPFPALDAFVRSGHSGHRYPTLALPVSDWFVGSHVAQWIESRHTPATIHALVDFYHRKGYLLNLYGHSGTAGGLMRVYASYAARKPRIWSTNSVGLYDWWVKRDGMTVIPSFHRYGHSAIATAGSSAQSTRSRPSSSACPIGTRQRAVRPGGQAERRISRCK